jgi:membrane-associated PAP2 superfamily phosphatase
LAGCEFSEFDLRVQDLLFDFAHGCWRVDGAEPLGRALFYAGPKLFLAGFGFAALMLGVSPARLRAQLGFGAVPLVGIWVFVLTLATTPALVGWSKSVTNVFCPSEIRRYGGQIPYVKLFEVFPPKTKPPRKGRSFPAGHASGGFALMALAGTAHTRRGQIVSISVGLAMGSAMGVYQMAKGAHYLSHTVITALLAWIIFALWSRCLSSRTAAILESAVRTQKRREP